MVADELIVRLDADTYLIVKGDDGPEPTYEEVVAAAEETIARMTAETERKREQAAEEQECRDWLKNECHAWVQAGMPTPEVVRYWHTWDWESMSGSCSAGRAELLSRE